MNTLRDGTLTRAAMLVLAMAAGGCAQATSEPQSGVPTQDGGTGGSGGTGGTGGTGGAAGDSGSCICAANTQVECTCAGGVIGSKTCAADCLSYSTCECNTGTGGTGGTGTGGTGTGGTGTGGTGGTAGSGTGGTGGGADCGSAVDVCPGQAIALTGSGTDPRVGSASGDTSTLCHDYSGTCGSSSSASDAVFSFTPDIDGTATVSLGGDAVSVWDAVLYARTTCTDSTTEIKCSDSFNQYTPGGETMTFPATANTTYYMFVDGYSSMSGAFDINVKVVPKGCGDGIVQPPEQCDDGNKVDNDFCKNDCTTNPHPAGDTCPGMTLTLNGVGTDTRTASVSGDTTNMANDYSASCASSSGAAPDMVFAITPDVDGTMAIDLGSTSWDAVVSVRTTCDNQGSEVTCADEPENALITGLPVMANTTYYAILDGYSSASGPFQFNVSIKPAYCGNGTVEGTEQCDDGNKLDGDGCDHFCQIEPKGPADVCPGVNVQFVQSGGSQIASISGSTTGMTPAYKGSCGSSDTSPDQVYHFNSGTGGTVSLTLPTSTTNYDATLYVRKGACSGPSAVEVACDDAIGNGGEAITFKAPPNTDYWVFVDGYSGASGNYSLEVTLTPSCGDGVVDPGEQCDDGNVTPGDGCDASCVVEASCSAVQVSEPDSPTSPTVIPSACGTFLVHDTAITDGDADYYQFNAAANATIDAHTFVGSPGTCPAGTALVMSLWKGAASAVAPNNLSCTGQTGNVACAETASGDWCSSLSYSVPAASAGPFQIKVYSRDTHSTVASYDLLVTVH